MHNTVPMAILHCTDDLLEEPPSFGFMHLCMGSVQLLRSPAGICQAYLSLFHDVVEEFASGILDHHDDICWCGDDLVSMSDRT